MFTVSYPTDSKNNDHGWQYYGSCIQNIYPFEDWCKFGKCEDAFLMYSDYRDPDINYDMTLIAHKGLMHIMYYREGFELLVYGQVTFDETQKIMHIKKLYTSTRLFDLYHSRSRYGTITPVPKIKWDTMDPSIILFTHIIFLHLFRK